MNQKSDGSTPQDQGRALPMEPRTLSSTNAVKHYSFLFQAARTLNTTLHVDEILHKLLALARQHFQPDAVSVALVEADGSLHFKAAASNGAPKIRGIRLPPGTGIVGWVAQHGRPLWIPDVSQDERWYRGVDAQTGFKTQAIYAAPVQHSGQIMAVIEMVNPSEDMELREYEEVMAALTALAASAIRNAELFEQVSRTEERYQRLFELNIDPIIILDAQGRLLESNQAAQELIDCPEKGAASCLPLLGLTTEQFADIRAKLRQQRSFATETTIPLSPEETRTLEVHMTRLTHYSPIEAYQWLGHDITDRVALEEMREQLSHMIVHDLRNPLGSIISSLNLVEAAWKDKDTSMPIAQILHIAARNARRMDRLIGNILDTARLRSGDSRLSQTVIDIEELVQEVEEILQPSLMHRRQTLRVHLPEEPLPTMQGDLDLMRRVVINLLDNASKFSPAQGTLDFWITCSPDDFRFKVKDSGPGVPPEDRERIFDLYVRGKDGQQTRGAGIGLTFCRLAVEAHGGKIWVEDSDGKGATFVFTIPKEIPNEVLFF